MQAHTSPNRTCCLARANVVAVTVLARHVSTGAPHTQVIASLTFAQVPELVLNGGLNETNLERVPRSEMQANNVPSMHSHRSA